MFLSTAGIASRNAEILQYLNGLIPQPLSKIIIEYTNDGELRDYFFNTMGWRRFLPEYQGANRRWRINVDRDNERVWIYVAFTFVDNDIEDWALAEGVEFGEMA